MERRRHYRHRYRLRELNMRLYCGQQRGTSNPVSCDIAPLRLHWNLNGTDHHDKTCSIYHTRHHWNETSPMGCLHRSRPCLRRAFELNIADSLPKSDRCGKFYWLNLAICVEMVFMASGHGFNVCGLRGEVVNAVAFRAKGHRLKSTLGFSFTHRAEAVD